MPGYHKKLQLKKCNAWYHKKITNAMPGNNKKNAMSGI